MRITRELDYAIRICSNLAKNYNEVVPAQEISTEEHVPLRFTLRILRKLSLAGLAVSVRGAKGGYKFAHRPEEICLYDILLAIDGPLVINNCLDPEGFVCERKEKLGCCTFHNRFLELQGAIIKELKKSILSEYI